jgi:peptidoglycan/LPS O-acetylase OafA/YrhL
VPANLESFAAGGMVALLSREHGNALRYWAPRLAIASGFFILGMWAAQRHFNFWYAPVQMLTVGTTALVTFFAASIGCLVIADDHCLINRVLSISCLKLTGKYSYAMYLFHASVIELVAPLIFSHGETTRGKNAMMEFLFFGIVAAISYGMASLSWYILERPFLTLKNSSL